MLAELWDAVRQTAPLVHNITNYVTANDCANVQLACGASPVMAEDVREVEEITALARALCLNIGTQKEQTVPAMLLAGHRAAALGHPIVLDPVGVGASTARTESAQRLLRELPICCIRGNVSEIRALADGNGRTRGVEADAADLSGGRAAAETLAKRHRAVVVMSGETDWITDGEKACIIRNGDTLLGRITGAGCMLSALTAALLAASPERTLDAAVTAACAMGLCGEIAAQRLQGPEGVGSFRIYLLDAVSKLTGQALQEGARYELQQ